MIDGEMPEQLGGDGEQTAEVRPAAEPTRGPLDEARLAFTSRLASFGLGEATERLLEAGGIIPPGRRPRSSPIRDDLQLG